MATQSSETARSVDPSASGPPRPAPAADTGKQSRSGGARGQRRAPGGDRRFRFDKHITPYLFIAPFFVVFGVFGLYPLLYTMWVSMHDWEMLGGNQGFVGLENFQRLFGDEDFYNALGNTFSIFLISTVPQLLFALFLAAMLNTSLRGRAFWRASILVPNIVSVVAIGIIFTQFFSNQYGMVNWLLEAVGLEPVDWRGDTWSSQLAVSIMVMWRWAGYNALIYLAAMQGVPKELYESAMLDGASRWRQFWSVTIPSIRPTIIFTVIISTVGGLQLFSEPFMYDAAAGSTDGSGGSQGQFQTLMMLVFRYLNARGDYGYASAVSWVLFIIIALVALLNFAIVRRISSAR
ncbi:carbohydrate ABC transporter permease [Allostreptomyces psammosilenae]|uniref:Cellobiose transport system permease protein n=1 Tax=Allostreptomyces psammosilenae TaxID=1892865 RepID=A0A852ZLK4_9ACTN|nr:sugar ABC transporter permease [Allostreptomyces psammosilenae]NYI03273.1 cellobiose transport system permease protein [Allostreptomyces psammosilenae]